MKLIKSSLLLIFLFFAIQIIPAQDNSKTYDFKDFDKVQIENVNGEIEIELGKQYAIIVKGKDNAQEQVQITKSEDKLLIKLDNKYISDWEKRKAVNIKIVMPEISKLFNNSNADVNIKSFVGRYCGIDNNGNGNVSLLGSVVDFIEINNNGNGNIVTKDIFSKKAEVAKSGNGDVSIKTDNNFNVEMVGNGDIVNYGKGKAIIKKQSGNGKIVYKFL